MRLLILAPATILLAACGSNVPPPDDSRSSTRTMPGMVMPAVTGDQDRDFAKMMIAHHQGAIDMARVQLARGKDPALRKMAGEVIAVQQREIAELNAYLDRSGGR